MTELEEKFLKFPSTLEIEEYMKLIKTLMQERDSWLFNAQQSEKENKRLYSVMKNLASDVKDSITKLEKSKEPPQT